MSKENEEEKICGVNANHSFEEIERNKFVREYSDGGFFSNALVFYGIKVTQKCSRCGIYNIVEIQ